jgi:hypothetical protein
MQNDFILIGIDGGATKVSAWQIEANEHKTYSLGAKHATKNYREIPGFINHFKVVDISKQLKENTEKTIKLTVDEEQQGAVYIEACAQAIEAIILEEENTKLVVGIGMPGLKTSDLRGISVVANGPRIPHYLYLLEKRLALKNIQLFQPIAKLGSDADYCGFGEEYAKTGAFRTCSNAYYLGGGTGAADALKLNGKLLPFDALKPWIAKTWEMKAEDERPLEKFASAGGIQSIFASFSGEDVESLNAARIYPPQIAEKAYHGEKAAQKTYHLVVQNLSLLLYERITTIYAGWQNIFSFVNPSRPPIEKTHPHLNTLFDKIIIGQRLGYLFEMPAGIEMLKKPLIKNLKALIQHSDCLDQKAKEHYADMEKIMIASQLKEAPALGAGIDAAVYIAKKQNDS